MLFMNIPTFIKRWLLSCTLWVQSYWRKKAFAGEAIICLIDIANYSRWSKRHRKFPDHIYRVMYKYNEQICAHLRKYDKLQKIEMVGDSLLVVSLLTEERDRSQVFIQMLAFASDVLSHVPRMKVEFADESISLRIGMHVGQIYGGYINHPSRFQIFGHPVNVASRLQSRTVDNSILITDKSILNILHNRSNSHSSDSTDSRRTSMDTVDECQETDIDPNKASTDIVDTSYRSADSQSWYPMFDTDGVFQPDVDDASRLSTEFITASHMVRRSVGSETFKGVGDYTVSRLYSNEARAD